jgi:HlyD family secretion protein
MTGKKKVVIAIIVVVVFGAIAGANIFFKRDTGLEVITEAIRPRDLEAVVSASGKIQPKRQVNITANRPGRVTRLAVEEGQRVKQGQFLLEIDPRSLEGQLQRGEASIAAARSSLEGTRASVEQAQANLEQSRAALDLSRQNLKRQDDLWKEGLTTRQDLERAQNEVAVQEATFKARQQDLRGRQQEIQTQQERIRQEQAGLSTTRYDLSQVVIASPIDGLVTRRNIEEGETAVVGTMNNAGSQLLTIADMSVLEAEVEVDETDIPEVAVGQAVKVTIDAVPNRTFKARVTEIGNSPINASTNSTAQRQATVFKVVVTLEEEVPDVRPGFTCTAEITTATRKQAVSVPIQALTVREMLFDDKGNLVHEPPRRRRGSSEGIEPTVSASNEPPPGHTREETEGVFVYRDNRAVFVPVKVGVAGEQYFEVLNGLKAGDQVITGPFASVREIGDGEPVRLQPQTRGRR